MNNDQQQIFQNLRHHTDLELVRKNKTKHLVSSPTYSKQCDAFQNSSVSVGLIHLHTVGREVLAKAQADDFALLPQHRLSAVSLLQIENAGR